MIKFQPVTEGNLNIVLEILNSNSHYNMLYDGNPTRTMDYARSEFLNGITESYFIILKNTYIGLIDFLDCNPKDNYPWLGLLMIHGDYHFKGYGKMAYLGFEDKLKERFDTIRLGILEKNTEAREFWTTLGFNMYANTELDGNLVECYEKSLI